MTLKLIKELCSETRIEDLPKDYQLIADRLGIENLLELTICMTGELLYIPKPDTIVREARNRRIIQEYNGYNEKELAIKYGLTNRMIKNIIKNT